MGEFGLIARLTSNLGTNDAVVEGVGDDCAVLRCGGALLLASCDASVEGVHFSRRYSVPEDIGWRAAASALSDIAAMGGEARFALVSLACPPDTATGWLEALYEGLGSAVRAAGAVVVGGDTTGSREGVMIDVTVLGEATAGRPLPRRGAQPGDALVVTGFPGDSAAGLAALQRGVEAPGLVRAHLRPTPRLREGQWLAARQAVHAMIDVSDGLLQDAGHMAKASGVGIDVEAGMLPVSGGLRQWAEPLRLDPTAATLTGGEAYELLFTVNGAEATALVASFRETFGTPISVVGRCTDAWDGMRVDGRAYDGAEGFNHFG